MSDISAGFKIRLSRRMQMISQKPKADDDNVPAEVSEEPVATDAKLPVEIGGRKGPEPTRYGDWEKNGRCIDF